MTVYNRGDVVLVGFLFSDESTKKLRPAVVISSAAYNRSRQDIIVAAITSNTKRRLFGDYLLAGWKGAGLLFPSLVTGIFRTIKQTMIDRKVGTMPKPDMSYGVDYVDLFRRAAVYVDKILRGAKPAELPVQQATKFEFVVNLKAAKQIGLTIPVRVLERANKVIK